MGWLIVDAIKTVANEPIWAVENVIVVNESYKLSPHKFYEKIKSDSVIMPIIINIKIQAIWLLSVDSIIVYISTSIIKIRLIFDNVMEYQKFYK